MNHIAINNKNFTLERCKKMLKTASEMRRFSIDTDVLPGDSVIVRYRAGHSATVEIGEHIFTCDDIAVYFSGAQTDAYIAVSSEYSDENGCYFTDDDIFETEQRE